MVNELIRHYGAAIEDEEKRICRQIPPGARFSYGCEINRDNIFLVPRLAKQIVRRQLCLHTGVVAEDSKNSGYYVVQ